MSQLKLNLKKSAFLPTFYPLITDYSNLVEFYYGGRASGKTYFCVQKLLLKGLKEKRFILLMEKQTNRVVDGVWKELRQAIEHWQLTRYFEFNKTEYRATCKINGTEIRCLGLQEPERIKGYSDISDVYMDEASSFTLEDFLLIRGTVRSTKYELPLQILLSTNPVSKANWVYSYFGFADGLVPQSTLIHHSTYLDNPNCNIQQYMDDLKLKNPARYKIEALGEFASLDRLVYPYYTIGLPPTDRTNLEFICGLDFGYVNDPSFFVASYVDQENKKIYIYDEYSQKGLLNDEIARIIISKGYGKEIIIADSAEQKSIEEIRRAGIIHIKPSVKGKDSILNGIQLIQQYDLIVSPNCQNIQTELENYTWQKDKSSGEYINKPIDAFNHGLDALRYSMQALKGQGRLKTMNKSVLGL